MLADLNLFQQAFALLAFAAIAGSWVNTSIKADKMADELKTIRLIMERIAHQQARQSPPEF